MKPALILYCQHSLGMGHLVRSLAVAEALAVDFDVHFLNGGRWPAALARPACLRIVDLPPLGMAEDASLLSLDARLDVATALALRAVALRDLARSTRPAAVVIEMYPFGRKKFSAEIEGLIDEARGALICCSVRDILVGARHDQQRHDDRAARILNERFDCVVVHADEAFARLEETFQPGEPLRTAVHYSGFVSTAMPLPPTPVARSGVLVSAGGGAAGMSLLQLALAAQPGIHAATGLAMTVLAGPFLPTDDWQALQREAAGRPALSLLRETPDLQALLRAAAVSVSQCGYNTAMDLLRTRTPSVVVPFVRERETEQLERSQRLARLGLVTLLHPTGATPAALAEAVAAAHAAGPASAAPLLHLDGAARTSELLRQLVAARQQNPGAA